MAVKYIPTSVLLESSLEELMVDAVDVTDTPEDGPTFFLSPELREKLYTPWQLSLIVKVVGKALSYTSLLHRLTSIWTPQGKFHSSILETISL